MKRHLFFFLFFAVGLLLFSCSKSNEVDVRTNFYGSTPVGCDTANMSFATNIKPILQSSCYTCHSNVNYPVSGIRLEDYDDLKEHVEDGDLMGTITHAAGFPAMPEDGPKLSDCDINKIKAWVDAGALNN